MKVTTQTLDNRQVEVAIEVEDERIQQALQRTARKISEHINIPGFRRGKAPYNIVMRAVGKEALYEEMLKELGPKLLEEALAETDFTPYRSGEMSDLRFEPFSFKVTFPLPPVVELGDYRNLRVPFSVPPVPEEEINAILEGLRERQAVIEPAGDGPAAWGHIVVLDIRAQLAGGEDLDLSQILDESGHIALLLDEQNEFLAPGFLANIIGMKVGQEKTFSLVFPPDFRNEGLRGASVEFTVRLDDLKKPYIPPLDDALAQTVGNYDSLNQLRAALRSMLEQRATAETEAGYAQLCITRLAETASIEYAPIMVEEELDRFIQEVEARLKKQKMSLEEMLKLKKQTLEDYRQEMRPRAIARLREGLALGKFIQLENLSGEQDQVGEKVIDRAIERLKAICKGQAVEAADRMAEPGGEHLE